MQQALEQHRDQGPTSDGRTHAVRSLYMVTVQPDHAVNLMSLQPDTCKHARRGSLGC
jgi:hypothetical protein